jgi:hypothetical protein
VDACEPDAASVLSEINTDRSILDSSVTDVYNNILKPKLQEFVSSFSAHAEAVDDTTKLNINMTARHPTHAGQTPSRHLVALMTKLTLPCRHFQLQSIYQLERPRPARHASLMHVSSPVQDRSAQRADSAFDSALVRGSSSIIATIDLSPFDPIIMTDDAAVWCSYEGLLRLSLELCWRCHPTRLK